MRSQDADPYFRPKLKLLLAAIVTQRTISYASRLAVDNPLSLSKPSSSASAQFPKR
jgi:hypothetical protein